MAAEWTGFLVVMLTFMISSLPGNETEIFFAEPIHGIVFLGKLGKFGDRELFLPHFGAVLRKAAVKHHAVLSSYCICVFLKTSNSSIEGWP